MKKLIYSTFIIVMIMSCQGNRLSTEKSDGISKPSEVGTTKPKTPDDMAALFKKLQEQDDRLTSILYQTLEIPFEGNIDTFLKGYKSQTGIIFLEKIYSPLDSKILLGQLVKEEFDGINVVFFKNILDEKRSRLHRVEVLSSQVKLRNNIQIGMSKDDLIKAVGYEPSETKNEDYIYNVGMNTPLGSIQFHFENQNLKSIIFSFKILD